MFYPTTPDFYFPSPLFQLACGERRDNNVPTAFSPLRAVSRFSTSTPSPYYYLLGTVSFYSPAFRSFLQNRQQS